MTWSQVIIAFLLMGVIYIVEHWNSIERVLDNQLSMEAGFE
jgi:hypothetical protein